MSVMNLLYGSIMRSSDSMPEPDVAYSALAGAIELYFADGAFSCELILARLEPATVSALLLISIVSLLILIPIAIASTCSRIAISAFTSAVSTFPAFISMPGVAGC